jgi:CRISPR-associated exonuclease Cas4
MDCIPISSLNHYDYCPKRAWYIFVTGEFVENVHTVEGTLLHARADSSERTVRGDVIQTRTVYLYSTRYGLTGIADVVEEKGGAIYPVEYKKGRRGEWQNDQLQLCAQALCLAEMLRLPQPIPRGFLYYAATVKKSRLQRNYGPTRSAPSRPSGICWKPKPGRRSTTVPAAGVVACIRFVCQKKWKNSGKSKE